MSTQRKPAATANSPATMRKANVTMLTQAEFWREGAGLWARTRQVVRFLAEHTNLRVIFAGPLSRPPYPHEMKALGVKFALTAPGMRGQMSDEAIADWIPRTLHAQPVDVCWIDKTELSWLLPIIPKHARTVVDTHDLMSHRHQSFTDAGMAGATPVVTEQEEIATLSRYDRVICIQQEDRDTVAGWLGLQRAFLAPHPVTVRPHALRPRVASITYVASDWLPNVEGLQWFLDSVWPQVRRPGLQLDVWGTICQVMPPVDAEDVMLHGFAPSLDAVYDEADIVINVVRAGAGLKIKSVEALANGLPLVTTGEGARGLRDLDGTALVVADSADDFAAALNRLVDDPAARTRLGEAGLAHATRHWTPAGCFGDVLAWINGCARRKPR